MPPEPSVPPRERTDRDWRAELRAAVAFHDLTISGHNLVGGGEDKIEQARLAAVAVIDRAQAAGVSEQAIDEEIAAYRRETDDA